jgi:hypothetical protein
MYIRQAPGGASGNYLMNSGISAIEYVLPSESFSLHEIAEAGFLASRPEIRSFYPRAIRILVENNREAAPMARPIQ